MPIMPSIGTPIATEDLRNLERRSLTSHSASKPQPQKTTFRKRQIGLLGHDSGVFRTAIKILTIRWKQIPLELARFMLGMPHVAVVFSSSVLVLNPKQYSFDTRYNKRLHRMIDRIPSLFSILYFALYLININKTNRILAIKFVLMLVGFISFKVVSVSK